MLDNRIPNRLGYFIGDYMNEIHHRPYSYCRDSVVVLFTLYSYICSGIDAELHQFMSLINISIQLLSEFIRSNNRSQATKIDRNIFFVSTLKPKHYIRDLFFSGVDAEYLHHFVRFLINSITSINYKSNIFFTNDNIFRR